jgi:hypothetical protein
MTCLKDREGRGRGGGGGKRRGAEEMRSHARMTRVGGRDKKRRLNHASAFSLMLNVFA